PPAPPSLHDALPILAPTPGAKRWPGRRLLDFRRKVDIGAVFRQFRNGLGAIEGSCENHRRLAVLGFLCIHFRAAVDQQTDGFSRLEEHTSELQSLAY